MITQMVGTEDAAPAAPRSWGYEWQWGWALVVIANLPMPLLFGFAVTEKGGMFGMLAGIVAFWLVGAIVVARFPQLRSTLVIGGLFFAPSQFLPVAQILAGVMAVGLCAPKSDPMSELTGFLVTVVTGGQLLFMVIASGWFLRALGRLVAGHPHRNPS